MIDPSESEATDRPGGRISKASGWAQLASLPLVACAVFGAGFGADPTVLIAPALLLGTAFGAAIAPRGKAEQAWAPPVAVGLIASLPVWLPWISRLGPIGTVLAVGGTAWLLIPRISPRRLPPLGPGAAAVAIGLLAALNSAVPSSGLLLAAVAGGLLALPSALLELPSGPTPVETGESDDGLLLGIVAAGVVPVLAIAGGPIFGPSPSWLAEALTGFAAGTAGAALLRRFAPRFAALLPLVLPLAILGAGMVLLQGHDGVGWLIAQGVPASAGGAPLAAGLLTGGLFAGVGLTAGPAGSRTAWGLAIGAVLWIVLPDLLGADLAVRALVVAAALRVLTVVVSTQPAPVRAMAALAAAAGLSGLALPAAPSGIRAVAPYAAFTELGTLGQLDLAAGWRGASGRASARGSLAVLDDLRPPIRWQRGQSIDHGRETISADAFFAHLPGLLRGDAPTSVLIIGGGHGGAADSARRAAAGGVTVLLRSPADRWMIKANGPWNQDVAADPAVRVTSSIPRGARFSAVLVDLPPVWVPGAAHEWSPAAIARAGAQLDAGGVVVFRLPLATISGDELAGFAGDVADRFPQVTAWLDPTGSAHLLLAASETAGAVEAGAAWRAWSRRVVKDELRRASLAGPTDALERMVTDRDGLIAMAAGRARRDRFGAAIVAGVRVRGDRRALPLATLRAAGGGPERLFDLSTVPEAERAEVRERLATAALARNDYLAMLEALASGDSVAALDTARRIAESGDDSTKDLKTLIEPWLARCRALRAQGFLDQAKAECLVAQSFSPTDNEAALLLADLHRGLHDLAAAEVLYEAVSEREPANVGALLGLASIRVLQNRLPDAVAFLEQAEQIEPGNALLLNNLASVHFSLAKRASSDAEAEPHVQRARTLFQAAASLEPRMAEPRAGLAEIYSFAGNPEAALTEIERAVFLDPRCQYRAARSQALYEVNQRLEASKAADEVLLECPDELIALGTKAMSLMDRGCFEQAYETYGRVLQIIPNSAKTRAMRAGIEASGYLERGGEDCVPL